MDDSIYLSVKKEKGELNVEHTGSTSRIASMLADLLISDAARGGELAMAFDRAVEYYKSVYLKEKT